ncbi:hypothetical protein LTR53_011598 [Teratosphaeriaceae sp. CCFEE 6253]|nr:hypothetical protein LTR53_011598 [Teratosphaeriaceae sp. CCFEE 6253]
MRESERMADATPLTQHEDVEAAAVPVATGSDVQETTPTAPKASQAQRAIAKSEAMKATITHRPKTPSPLKVSVSAEPPPLPARIASSMDKAPRFAVQGGSETAMAPHIGVG